MHTRLKSQQRYVRRSAAFTLIEVLVSVSILALLMVLVSNVIFTAQRAWSRTSRHVSQFREARKAFDTIKRYLGQASLNTYMRYSYADGSFSPFTSSGAESKNLAPTNYSAYSELQFICGPTTKVLTGSAAAAMPGHAVFFQAPIGWSPQYANMPTLLNGRGYFVQFGNDLEIRPDFLKNRLPPINRYRLMEYAPPAEMNQIYDQNTAGTQSDWFADYATFSRPLASNILALIISPRRPNPPPGSNEEIRDIAPAYTYDSSNSAGMTPYELPAVVDVIMVVIDERSAQRLAEVSGESPPITLSGFTQATGNKMMSDLQTLEADLISRRVDYRIFSTSVPLRNSKWASR